MSSGNKNIMPVNWQEVPDKELGLDITMAKLQEKFQCKWVQEAKEVKKHREAKEAKKRVCEAEEAKKRACKAEVQHWEVAAIERQREAEQQREAEWQREAERAKEAKKWQCTKSKARPSGAQGQESKCVWCAKASAMCIVRLGMKRKMGGKKKKRTRRAWLIFNDNDNDNDNIVVTSTCKARKSESGAWEMMAQVVDRRMGKVVEELWGLRKGVAIMAKSNQDLTQVLYCRFQSVDTLVDKVQIFGAEGFLPKPAPESKPAKDKLQETLREVEELQEEHLEWAMEHLQMRKEWMWQEEAALTEHLKGKGKEPAREEEQEGDEQEGDEQGEGEAK
ncbi:hypothetical protein ID866_10863 [Astraeus odoratus]|nr:hypothetical protein ID866_10863 [Astraeus odoratus]